MQPPSIVGMRALSALCAAGLGMAFVHGAEDGATLRIVPRATLVTAPSAVAVAPVADAPIARERSALLSAALERDWEQVKQLLAEGADPKAPDQNGLTPLMAAAMAGHVPTIEALIAAGAPVEVVDARVRTALGYAIGLRRKEAVEVLLAHQPQLPAAAEGGDDLAAVALDSGDPKLFDTVLRRMPAGLTWTMPARIAFAKALAARDKEMGTLLLGKYAGPAAADDQSQPLLAYAVVRGDVEQIRALLDFGVDPDTLLSRPKDPVFRNALSSSYIRYYLDNTQGLNVLMLAAALKQTACVKLLLERGATRYASTQGKAKLIALYFAAWADDPDTIQALIVGAPSKESYWIDISIDEQRARYYRAGILMLTTAVSTGRPGFPTRPGEYVITDKNRVHRSTIYHDASMPFFMRLSCRDFGLHEGVVPGYPASHGCIRLPGNVAQQFFKEVPVGTWVTVRTTKKETASSDTAGATRKRP